MIADISKEECAKICVENPSFICKSFDYCEDTQLCMNRSKHFINRRKSPSGLIPSAYCSHYVRQHTPPKVPAKPQKTGYSSGSMGALGFFMLLIGIVGGVMA